MSCRTVLILLLLPSWAAAQAPPVRFELAQRLRVFDRALEKQTDEAVRRKAVGPLKPITFLYFTGQITRAARLLDEARLTLEGVKEREPALWAASLSCKPVRRLLDRDAGRLTCTIAPFYPVKEAPARDAQARLTLLDGAGKTLAGPTRGDLKSLPTTVTLPFADIPEGDHLLRFEVVRGDAVVVAGEQTVSLASRLAERRGKLAGAVEMLADAPRSAERETVRHLSAILKELEAGGTLETDYPAVRLLKEAEELAAAVRAGRAYYGPKQVGEHWLVLPTKAESTVRLMAPEAARKGGPLPLVIALHGAGGSENMFFDAYGDGLIARLCAQRGWLLVAPRGGLPEGLIDEVARLYPVDRKRVFLVGHSMGAAQAVGAASRAPRAYAGVAALGGAGGITPSGAIRDLPFFIGIGSEDFALSGARFLRRNLEQAAVKRVEYREYEGMEHLVVVQLALREVFAFFEKSLAAKP